jgi:hypothetical protein
LPFLKHYLLKKAPNLEWSKWRYRAAARTLWSRRGDRGIVKVFIAAIQKEKFQTVNRLKIYTHAGQLADLSVKFLGMCFETS